LAQDFGRQELFHLEIIIHHGKENRNWY